MARLFTRQQALENRAFLKQLRRTGNVRLAARELGLKYGTMQHRRRTHPEFALRWDAALAFAWASFDRLRMKGITRVAPSASRPQCSPLRPRTYKSAKGPLHRSSSGPPPRPGEDLFRTAGGEMVICRRNDGRLQMRRAQPGKLTLEAEQAFLAALSATCNMSLAAAAVGAAEAAFHRRRRKDPGFARELRLALAQGYDALELALIEAGMPGSHEQDEWRHNEPPAMPPMSVGQALQLMYLHQKEARLLDEPDWLKRRRGESRAAHSERLTAMAEERERRAREAFEIAEAERRERGLAAWGPAGEEVRRADDASRRRFAAPQHERSCFGLPDLAQVTGWSKADPTKAPHDPTRALFGGWRIEQMTRAQSVRWTDEDEAEELRGEEGG